MLKFLVYFATVAVAISLVVAEPENGAMSLLAGGLLCAFILVIIRRFTDEKDFITQVFLGAVCARIIFGLILHVFDLQMFAGPDSLTYHRIGAMLADAWLGYPVAEPDELAVATSLRGSGWGMSYLIGSIYLITGQSILVAQTVFGIIGAATAPMVYYCALSIYHNRRVARFASIGVAFFPAFIIWSSQLIKDGLIVFLLVVAVIMILQLQKKFSLAGTLMLVASLIGLLSLRFYTFYVVVIAVVGGFVVGIETSFKNTLQRLAILAVVSFALVYLGVVRIASVDLETYGSLERIQYSRNVMASGESGYGSDMDVSTSDGALSALPVGFAYLMFAPFPWEMKNLRQSLTLPDVLLWWAMMPLLVIGLWHAFRHRLRENVPVIIFTFILTLAYSMFQGNLGAAYRQRTQIQVFLFMFIAVGWGLIREKIEDKKAMEVARKNVLNKQLKARFNEQQKAT